LSAVPRLGGTFALMGRITGERVDLAKNPKNASTRLSMNGKSPKISISPPFVLRPSKDERRVFSRV
jgi:hypothetical protein